MFPLASLTARAIQLGQNGSGRAHGSPFPSAVVWLWSILRAEDARLRPQPGKGADRQYRPGA